MFPKTFLEKGRGDGRGKNKDLNIEIDLKSGRWKKINPEFGLIGERGRGGRKNMKNIEIA